MPLYRHTLSGTFPGEVWSFGLHTNGSLALAAAQSAWQTAVAAFFSVDYSATLATTTVANEVTTAELVQATGKQSSKAADPVNFAGTSTAESLPFQCAPVVSLRSALATRAGRGRFYAPSLAVDQVNDGRMILAARDSLADSAAAMLSSLNDAGLAPVLYSRTTHNTQQILRLDVGDVIDTQRRRRNKLIEVRTSRPL